MRLTLRLLQSKSPPITSPTTFSSSSSPSSSPFPWLQTLKTKQLQHLAQKTGLPSSGTKAVLLNGLQSGLVQYQQGELIRSAKGDAKGEGEGEDRERGKEKEKEKEKESDLRILSIDMGIRNLAFAVLGVRGWSGAGLRSSSSFMVKEKEKENEKEKRGNGVNRSLELSLDAWRRVSLPLDRGFSAEEFAQCLDEGLSFSLGRSTTSASASTSGVDSNIIDRDSNPIAEPESPSSVQKGKGGKDPSQAQPKAKAKDKEKEKEKQSFSLQVYATHAHSIISTLLARYNPTHILIERQRFRSGGGAAVQEWSLRVGVFEGMLWAVLHSLQQQHGRPGPRVIAVEPGRVGRFWMPHSSTSVSSSSDSEGVKKGKKLSTNREGKKVKIDLVKSWLEGDTGVTLARNGDGVQEWVDGYMAKWKKSSTLSSKSRSKSKSTSPSIGASAADIGKLDDLADCLVQGVTWLEWERMKGRVLRDGFDGVLHVGV